MKWVMFALLVAFVAIFPGWSAKNLVVDLTVVIKAHAENDSAIGKEKWRALADNFLHQLSIQLKFVNDISNNIIVDAARVAIVKEYVDKAGNARLEVKCNFSHFDPPGCVRSSKYNMEVKKLPTGGLDADGLRKFLEENVHKPHLGDRSEVPNYNILIAIKSDNKTDRDQYAERYKNLMHIVLLAEQYGYGKDNVLIISHGGNRINKVGQWNKTIGEIINELDAFLLNCKTTSNDSICYNMSDGCYLKRTFISTGTENCPTGTGDRRCPMNRCSETCDMVMNWTECDCKTNKQTKTATNKSWPLKYYEKCVDFKKSVRECMCPTEAPKALLEGWAIGMIVLGSIAGLLVIIAVIVCIFSVKHKRKRRARSQASPRPTFLPPRDGGKSQATVTRGASVTRR